MGRTSRTADPEGAPYRWVPYRAGSERVYENELDTCLQDRCVSQVDYDGAHGDIEAMVHLAERGLLHPPEAEAATPVRLDPDLWELRWSRPRSDDRLRIYFGEPESQREVLLALKAHWKWWTDRSSAQEVDAAQDRHMREAGARYRRSGFR